MDRRKALLVIAAVIAALGTVLVFLYARSADARAQERYETTEVLQVVTTIEPGESVEAAQRAGKVALAPVARAQVLPTAVTGTDALSGQVALTRIYPGEQVIPEKFGDSAESASSSLPIPDGHIAISVNLSDPARVAGFVNPSSEVAVFMNGSTPQGQPFTRMLLDRVTVLGVGSTTPIAQTTRTEEGTTTEELPSTLLTLAVRKAQAEKILFAQSNGELAFGLTTDSSTLPKGAGATSDNLFGG